MKHCLIIDDQNQKDQMELLELKAKAMNFPITCHFLNLSDEDVRRPETRNGKPDLVLDFEKILEKLSTLYGNLSFDLVACDYKYDGDPEDGLKLIKFLKDRQFKGRGLPYLLYSSQDEEIERKLQIDVENLIDKKDELKDYLESYFESKPEKITKRTKYDDEIIEYLKKHKTSLSLKLEGKLKEHPQRTFNNVFPRFKGKTLGDLAKLLTKSTEESDDFESEFFERSIAHFIHLEE
jgi:hypothetical protein